MTRPKSTLKSTPKAPRPKTAQPQNKRSHSGGAERSISPIELRVAHDIAGRTRLRAAGSIEVERMQALVDDVAACPGVKSVVGRPNTGSLIVEHDLAAGAFMDVLRDRGVAQSASPTPKITVEQAAQIGLARVDAEIAHQTDGALGLRSAIATALILAAVLQASRGRIAGPATTLALSALTLLDQRRR